MGPEGKLHIEAFCAQQNQSPWQNHFAILSVVPRFDKTLPEWEYLHSDRKLTSTQIDKVLASFGTSSSQLETEIEDTIAEAVSQYMEGKF